VLAAQFILCAVRRRFGAQGNPVAALQRYHEPEKAAFARPAFDADTATHQLHQASGDHQAEAGAAVSTRGRGIDLFEGMEQARQFVGCDAYAGVFDLEAHQQVLALVLRAA
jgi:hypothetical protein